jgi:hypothetical protein
MSNDRLQKIQREFYKLHLDPGIFQLVAALQYCGFNTTGSCGGHYEVGRTIYPWVLIKPAMPDPFEKVRVKNYTPEFLDSWEREVEELKHRASAFNSLRRGTEERPERYPEDEELEVGFTNDEGFPPRLLMVLRPRGAIHLRTLPRELVSRKQAQGITARYRNAMERFARYLVEDFDKTHKVDE